MTAPPDDATPEPHNDTKRARPDNGQADDGRSGGATGGVRSPAPARVGGDRESPGLHPAGAKPGT